MTDRPGNQQTYPLIESSSTRTALASLIAAANGLQHIQRHSREASRHGPWQDAVRAQVAGNAATGRLLCIEPHPSSAAKSDRQPDPAFPPKPRSVRRSPALCRKQRNRRSLRTPGSYGVSRHSPACPAHYSSPRVECGGLPLTRQPTLSRKTLAAAEARISRPAGRKDRAPAAD